MLIIAASIVGGHRSMASSDDAVEKARLEKMLADGDTGMIVQVFRRHSGRTLPFIDSYLEGGLAMLEQGKDQAEALASFRTGIRFATLADEAFSGTTFSDYANSFASWSPAEQKSFREGQREYKAGVKEPDAQKSLEHLRKSLSLATPLGDAWGMAMAQQAMAEKFLAAGQAHEAAGAAATAAEINGKLKLHGDAAESLMFAARAWLEIGQQRGQVSYLSQAWTLVQQDHSIDASLREKVLDAYLGALEAAGKKDQAEQVRREAAGQAPAPPS
jgi:hypothetical protein